MSLMWLLRAMASHSISGIVSSFSDLIFTGCSCNSVSRPFKIALVYLFKIEPVGGPPMPGLSGSKESLVSCSFLLLYETSRLVCVPD